MRAQMPPASCPLGYTNEDLERHFGAKVGEPHSLWDQLRGQTGMICEGRQWNPETSQYEPDACAGHPHGLVTYIHDVREWVERRPPSDW